MRGLERHQQLAEEDRGNPGAGGSQDQEHLLAPRQNVSHVLDSATRPDPDLVMHDVGWNGREGVWRKGDGVPGQTCQGALSLPCCLCVVLVDGNKQNSIYLAVLEG